MQPLVLNLNCVQGISYIFSAIHWWISVFFLSNDIPWFQIKQKIKNKKKLKKKRLRNGEKIVNGCPHTFTCMMITGLHRYVDLMLLPCVDLVAECAASPHVRKATATVLA